MHPLISILATTSFLVASTSISANQVVEHSLEKKVADADAVFIGTVRQLDYVDPREPNSSHIALVHVDTPLKGEKIENVSVSYDNGIAEFAPLCCENGRIYVFFLKRTPSGVYESVNGPYGIYQVKGVLPTFEWQTER
ncbi:hypothetical protein EC912_10872 [Luteibacter rhizovicinus]|uniref:Uncharacterized protein n=1 Tax=Luteibacter rhizovicinus TaxID=242606 RepID=A0A4R3YIR6_9GAMM|nr:hypothetical protein [Luteibacter rhizovicinus]TCV92080.1 hypothetical protein EC912_10872 [Luteibacter rhizovicinus]